MTSSLSTAPSVDEGDAPRTGVSSAVSVGDTADAVLAVSVAVVDADGFVVGLASTGAAVTVTVAGAETLSSWELSGGLHALRTKIAAVITEPTLMERTLFTTTPWHLAH
ncbi:MULTISPECIES: hypothetical protein [Kocuria]|uniref:Uncharacterized protein n=1 Tax=Kocuria subflava TaxID=1736139 RepID=A0A846UB83_9MICC|nr:MULTISPECIES: hypothetical protein [Kocuria]NKE10766.1 hypothetical protein [Kocuria subflava]